MKYTYIYAVALSFLSVTERQDTWEWVEQWNHLEPI